MTSDFVYDCKACALIALSLKFELLTQKKLERSYLLRTKHFPPFDSLRHDIQAMESFLSTMDKKFSFCFSVYWYTFSFGHFLLLHSDTSQFVKNRSISRGVRAKRCARHLSIGREKTGKTLTIKRRVWDLAMFTVKSQGKKKRRQKMIGFMPSLLVLLHVHLNFFVLFF